MSTQTKEELLQLLVEQKFRTDTNQIKNYKPYDWQIKFHKEGQSNPQRLLMAGNRTGKTYCGAIETAYHLTGDYPSWWKGRRFTKPIRAWVGGESNETTRDIVQKELFGQPDNPDAKGLVQYLSPQLDKLLENPVYLTHLTLRWLNTSLVGIVV